MSRSYEMGVEISGHDAAKAAQIQAAAKKEWPFADWWDNGDGEMQSSAQHQLCGGESEEEFTQRLSLAVWRANGAYCEVVVNATYMEELPYETHALDEDDYVRLVQGKKRSHHRKNPS